MVPTNFAHICSCSAIAIISHALAVILSISTTVLSHSNSPNHLEYSFSSSYHLYLADTTNFHFSMK